MKSSARLALLLSLCLAALALAASLPARAAISPPDWWNEAWRYRVPLQVGANGAARTDKPAEVSLNFTTLLGALGASGTLDLDSLRLLEVDAQGAALDESVPFQFDPAAGFNAATNASGTLVFLLEGATASGATRRYHLYFDTTSHGPFTPLSFTPQVTVTTTLNYEGQDSFRVQTASATYYYHKRGAGLASLIDAQSNDWISYHPLPTPTPGAEGRFRGVPNLGVWAHPGYPEQGSASSKGSNSVLTSSGPLKAVVTSTTTDTLRSLTWAFYPGYATMTLLNKPASENYWFLYEGTPFGGAGVDPNRDYYQVRAGAKTYVRADEQVTLSSDIVNPEWLFFGDDNTSRVLFLAKHEGDSHADYFRQQGDAMTVFGFGRKDPCCDDYNASHLLTDVPARFTLGFGAATSVTGTVNSAYLALSTATGQPQALNRSPVLGALTDKSVTAGETLTFMVSATDADGATPALSADPLPSGATFTDNGNGAGQFSWTPDAADVGAHPVTFTASDGALTDSATIQITVAEVPVTGLAHVVFIPLIAR